MTINNICQAAPKVFIGFLLTISFFGLLPAMAQATTMSPTRLELNGDAGQKAFATVKIYNDEKIRRTFFLSAARFESQGEGGDPVFIPGDRNGLVSWFEFPSSIEVGPQQSKEIPVSINVPDSAAPGGYFAAIFASIIPPASQDEGTVAVQSDVGTLILFSVNGDFAKKDSILEFNTKDKKRWHANLPVEFYFRFQNIGADRAQPLGDITVKNIFGGTAKIITANRGAGNVLPQGTRKFESAWVTSGGNKIEQHARKVEQPQFTGFWSHVQYEWSNFAFGRYRADLNVTVNNDASRSHAEKLVFWVIPWHLLLTILVIGGLFFGVVLAAAIVIILFIIRRRKQ